MSTPMPNKTRVLGVDPGFGRIGIAVLERGSGRETLLHSECIETDKKSAHEKRLLTLGLGVREIILEWKPSALAIEKLFFNQNISSALGVAEARGVIIYEAARAELSVYEYSPQDVKIAVTGYGKAEKAQMESMTRKLVRVPSSQKKRDDELDAIALCITHLVSHRNIKG
jgi:crossover junction endodeoxyribonuclease RuvC